MTTICRVSANTPCLEQSGPSCMVLFNGVSCACVRRRIALCRVCAGIVGYKKMAYELQGSTLEDAMQMEATGRPMMVQCTKFMAQGLQV